MSRGAHSLQSYCLNSSPVLYGMGGLIRNEMIVSINGFFNDMPTSFPRSHLSIEEPNYDT